MKFAAAIKRAREGEWIRHVRPVIGLWMRLKNEREFEDETGCTVALTVHHFDYNWETKPDDRRAA